MNRQEVIQAVFSFHEVDLKLFLFKTFVMKIPDSTKALVIETYNANLMRALRTMKIVEKPLILPKPGEVLVKMDASPVNPSDIAFLRGMYNINKALPTVPGFEGTGIIIKTGDETSENLVGRRISFFTQDEGDGAWCF